MNSKQNKRDEIKRALQNLKVSEPMKLKAPAFASPQSGEAAKDGLPRPDMFPPEEARGEHTHSEGAVLKRASAKDSRSTEAARIEKADFEAASRRPPHEEVPPSEITRTWKPLGFFKLAHSVFHDRTLRDLSGDAFRLYLWMASRAWKFPTSNGVLRASIRFMEDETGIPHATLSRCLLTLKSSGLVQLVRTDYKLGNVWKISERACGFGDADSGSSSSEPPFEPPHGEKPHGKSGAPPIRGASSLNSREELPQNECNLKKLRNKKTIQKENALRSANDDRLIAVNFLLDSRVHTLDDSKVPLQQFHSRLPPDERESFLRKFVEAEFAHGFLPPMPIVESMAARRWYQTVPDVQVN